MKSRGRPLARVVVCGLVSRYCESRFTLKAMKELVANIP